MSILDEARKGTEEVVPVLELIGKLHSQARQLLLEKGEDSIISKGIFIKKPKNPNKVIRESIQSTPQDSSIKVEIFSFNSGSGMPGRVRKALNEADTTFAGLWRTRKFLKESEVFSEDTPIIIHVINLSETFRQSLYLAAEHTFITDSIPRPPTTKELGELGLEDLQPWQEIIQQVEVSFKRQPLGHGEIPQ
jgi:hypothetical protein